MGGGGGRGGGGRGAVMVRVTNSPRLRLLPEHVAVRRHAKREPRGVGDLEKTKGDVQENKGWRRASQMMNVGCIHQRSETKTESVETPIASQEASATWDEETKKNPLRDGKSSGATGGWQGRVCHHTWANLRLIRIGGVKRTESRIYRKSQGGGGSATDGECGFDSNQR